MDVNLLASLMSLLTKQEADKLLISIAKSEAKSIGDLERHFARQGRRVAEELATVSSSSGNSIDELRRKIFQHLETVLFIKDHLDQLPQTSRTRFQKTSDSVMKELEALTLYQLIQKQHSILGILPRRLINKIINIDTIENKINKASEQLQSFFDEILEEINRRGQAKASSRDTKRLSSRPVSSISLNAVIESIQTRAKRPSDNASRVLSDILACLRNETAKTKPDLEALKESLAISLSALKKEGLSLEKKDINAIRLLLHPDRFQQEEEIQSISNALSAIFNRVMT